MTRATLPLAALTAVLMLAVCYSTTTLLENSGPQGAPSEPASTAADPLKGPSLDDEDIDAPSDGGLGETKGTTETVADPETSRVDESTINSFPSPLVGDRILNSSLPNPATYDLCSSAV
jgi:hypothetical protein